MSQYTFNIQSLSEELIIFTYMYIHVILIIVQVLGSVCVQKTEIHFKCQIENFVEEITVHQERELLVL